MAKSLAALAKQAAEELGIDTAYWYRRQKGGKLVIWTPYNRYTWTPPEKGKAPAAKKARGVPKK